MAWKVEFDGAAEHDLDKLDPQVARRILSFLFERVATLDDPRSIGRQRPAGTYLCPNSIAGTLRRLPGKDTGLRPQARSPDRCIEQQRGKTGREAIQATHKDEAG